MEDYQRVAVVTGANKGIGVETVRQLAASGGVTVVLTARDERRGADATAELHRMGLSNVVFHQLDVTDSDSIASLARFIGSSFGRLDIFVCFFHSLYIVFLLNDQIFTI
uniref:Uncharacterized protein n=1 Tax=Opuntia streptacantha TaxID=393608 RepID=A0A7C9AFA4_OPUST